MPASTSWRARETERREAIPAKESAGEVRVSSSNQIQVAQEPPHAIDVPGRFERGLEAPLRPQQVESRGGRHELHHGSRLDVQLGAAGVEDGAGVDVSHLDAPDGSRAGRGLEHAVEPICEISCARSRADDQRDGDERAVRAQLAFDAARL